MFLQKHSVDFSTELIDKAREELLKYEQEKSDQKCIWGYFPGLEEKEMELYPRSILLAQALDTFKHKGVDLTFIKLASGKPKAEFGGLHIDDGVSMGNKNIQGKYILRQILNLAEFPRILKYTEQSADELRREGIEISNNEYHPIELPSDVKTKLIEIPARTVNEIWSLSFWANETPHVGVTDERGYFIAGYGGYFESKDFFVHR